MKRFLATIKEISVFEIEVEVEDKFDSIDIIKKEWDRLMEIEAEEKALERFGKMSEAEKKSAYIDSETEATAQETW